MRKLFFLLLLGVLFLNVGSAMAASSKYEVSTKYFFATDGSAEATVSLTGENSTDEPTPDRIILPTAGRNTRDIAAKYEDGAEIQSKLSEDGKSIELTTSKDNSGNGKSWKLSVTYKSDLVKRYGLTSIFDIPSQSYGDLEISKEAVIVEADPELGSGVYRGPKPETASSSLEAQAFTWTSAEGPLNESVGLLFGEKSVADFNLETTLENSSWWWRTEEVVLPPDTNQQSVALNSIEPKPNSIRLDQDGNIIASYSIRPKGSVKVSAKGEIHISNYSYALNGGSGIENIPSNLKDNYTATNETWNGDQIDVEVKSDQPVSKMVEEIFNATVAKIPGEATGIDEAQKWSNALVGELRSAGIPARLILGQAYTDGVTRGDEPKPSAWAEVYVPATGWVTLDAMSERGQSNYGRADVERLALVMRGGDPGYPPEDIADYKFSWKTEAVDEPASATPELTSINNIILPGLAVQTVTVDMGSGRIVDDAGIDVEGIGLTKLGSLSPLETSKTNLPVLGAAAFANGKVKYGVVDGDTIPNVITETSTKNNFIPMIVVISSIVLSVVLYVVYKRRSNKKSDSKPKKSNLVLADDDSGMLIDNFDFDDEFDEEPAPVVRATPPPSQRPAQVPLQQPQQHHPRPDSQPRPAPITPRQPQNVTMNPQIQPKAAKRRPPRLIQ